MSKHTPGPWWPKRSKTESCDGSLRWYVEHDGAGIWNDGVPSVCSEANAHLIAAAPDLYEALNALLPDLDALGIQGLRVEAARAALAKAEPKPLGDVPNDR